MLLVVVCIFYHFFPEGFGLIHSEIALSFAPCMSFMSEWFVQRRGMANGIMFAGMLYDIISFAYCDLFWQRNSGTAVGGSIFPLILPHLINRFGILVTLRIFSFIVLGLMVPILPFLRPRLPESRVHGPGPSAHSRSWAKDPMFLLAVLANTFQGFAYFIPLIWLPSMLFVHFGRLHASSLWHGSCSFL